MNFDQIIAALQYNHRKFPHAAIAKAIEEKEAIVPVLLQVIKDTAKDIQKISDDPGYMLHIYAMYLLAQFRETDAYLPLIEFFSIPGDMPLDISGDVVTEDLGRILASTFNGDTRPLKALIENKNLNEYVRTAGLQTLCILWGCGAVSRQELVDCYRHTISEVLADHSYDGTLFISSSLKISPVELEEEINAAFDQGLIEEFFFNRDDFARSLELSGDEALAHFREMGNRHTLIEDTVSEMEYWACFRPDKPKKKIPVNSLVAFQEMVKQRQLLENSVSEKEGLASPTADKPQEKSPVNSTYRAGQKKTGRNEPCPCGSGKKYKKCCYA